jgi:lipopolysaccharide transport system ATP-binding protein
MSDIILKVENVSKQYQLGTFGTKTIGGDVHRWWTTKILGKEDPFLKVGEVNDRTSKEKAEFVWALQDINFEVKRGEVLGIIGKNGAGKSTLLKLLSRITSPTTGSIKSAGRMASLLEVGTGFHPELTGLENIYLNGAILGMTKSEINRKLEEIIDFSGCALYIDTPVKRYSSGMKVRLGFAVAAFLDPEILVVDEVLAVGDAEFQKKAIGKMKEISESGSRTVLFVSHNIGSIRKLCNTGVLLENGKLSFVGGIEQTIEKYQNNDEFVNAVQMPCKINNELTIIDFKIIQIDSKIVVNIKFIISTKINDFRIGIKVFNGDGKDLIRSLLTDFNTEYKDMGIGAFESKTEIDLSVLSEGIYRVALHHSVFGMRDYNLEDLFFQNIEIIKPKNFNNLYIREKTKATIITYNQWEIKQI